MIHHIMCWKTDCHFNKHEVPDFGYCSRESLEIDKYSKCDDYCISEWNGRELIMYYPNDHEDNE
jgi:hypothetical protein